ncbi:MAG: 3-methyl-2-oxobutanoate hydroxymethyltransferase [bacterium]|nr:MAG: 3-methyl-2-oxobutanoate hydroxymethyltransferase [bacterium]
MENKITIRTIREMKGRQRIAMLTAHDYPSALYAERAGAQIVLVGDSLGQVVLGYETTVPVTMEEMLHHTRAAGRGCSRALLVADMPFGSYQAGPSQAFDNACRFLKETPAHSVKLEGGVTVAETIRHLVSGGIPVMGHVGLTPQSVYQMGGYRIQGRGEEGLRALMDDARAVQDAGAYSVVLEGIPSEAARKVTEELDIPTIGIGAGPHCDGQVLVSNDLLGLYDRFIPKFVKRYALMGEEMERAFRQFVEEVTEGTFPDEEHSYE